MDHRETSLYRFLKAHGAENAGYRVDLQRGVIFWVGAEGQTLAAADCKAILSYALSNRSVLMAWANPSLGGDGRIERQPDFADQYFEQNEGQVWAIATAAAQSAEATAVYRTTSPQVWVMLGLWNLRAGHDEAFRASSPGVYVVQVLERLAVHPDQDELPVLLDNYAETFLQMVSHSHRGTEYEGPLKDTAREMRNLLSLFSGSEDATPVRRQLRRLQSLWGSENKDETSG